MSVSICVLITWSVLIIFLLIPKKLSEIDMVFLYFINTIFELSMFTIFHINLKWIHVSSRIDNSIADLVFRVIMIPFVFIIVANILLYPWKYLKWIIVTLIILSFLALQRLLNWLGVITTSHWNMIYTLTLFSIYAVFSRLMTGVIVHVDGKEVKRN